MLKEHWKKIEFFNECENWGDWKKVKFPLVFALDTYRKLINTPIIITSGTDGVHAKKSLHYTGEAVDIIIPEMMLLDAFLFATKIKAFTGIGLYSDWKYHGEKCGGLHLEINSLFGRRWLERGGVYMSVDKKNLKECGVI